jgi:hypothetical protein
VLPLFSFTMSALARPHAMAMKASEQATGVLVIRTPLL